MRKRSAIKYIICLLAVVITFASVPVPAFAAASNSKENKSENEQVERKSRKDKKDKDSSSDKKKKKKDEAKEDAPIKLECINQSMNMKVGDYISAEGVCYSFVLDDDSAEAYPKLSERIDEINEDAYSQFVNNMKKASDGSLQRHMDGWEYPFEEYAQAAVTRADGKAFSYSVSHYSFLGGAHGYTYYEGTAIDPVTCKDIKFSDVVTDVSDFPEIVFDEIISQYPEMEDYFEGLDSDKKKLLDRIKNDVGPSGDGPVWTLSYDGISIYFEDYAMGTYAAGSFAVDVPYKSHSDIFNKDYFTYDGKTPDIKDNVTVKDIEKPVTIEAPSEIMQVGYETEFQYSYNEPYCNAIVDELIIPDDHPSLKKAVDKINSANVKEMNGNFEDFQKDMKTEADESSGGDLLHHICTYGIYQYVTRADEAVFSTVESHEIQGATEDYRTLIGINLDPKTGKDIALDDVVTDISELGDTIEDILTGAYYPDNTIKDIMKELNRRLGSGKLVSSEKLSFAIGYEGLTFYLNNTVNYSVMDFGQNAMTVFVPYYGNDELFDEAFTDAPSSFAYQLPVSSVFSTSAYMDTGYDKVYKEIDLYPAADEYSTVTGFSFGINSSINRVENFYAYDITATYVKAPGGDCYVYIQCSLDDGYSYLRVLNFSFDSMYEDTDFGGIYYAVDYTTGYEDDECRGYIMTDPMDFHVLASDDVFGGRILFARCCIDSYGYPAPRDGIWRYPKDDDYDLKAVKDIKTDSGTIKKGETVSPIGIGLSQSGSYNPEIGGNEGEIRILILENSKGKEYDLEIEFDKDNWEWVYNGKAVKSLFDGNYDILF